MDNVSFWLAEELSDDHRPNVNKDTNIAVSLGELVTSVPIFLSLSTFCKYE